MPVPYTFGTATAAIPLTQLDSNFATAITIGNTAVYLGNTTTSIGNLSLANVTITSVSTPITPAQGGTGLTSITANSVMIGNATGSVLLVSPGTAGNVLVSNGTTWTSNAASSGQVYPGAGIANSTGSAWGTSYTTNGSGTVVALTTSPTLVTPNLGTPTSLTLTSATGLPLTTGVTGTLPIANGGTNSTATATAGGVAYGTGTAIAVNSAGTAGYLLQSNGASAPTWVAASGGFNLGTPVATTSGTSIDFTGIPSGTKQIIITFKGVSTNGTDPKYIQIGDSGGIENSDYSGSSAGISETAVITASSSLESFNIKSTSASDLINGSVILTLENSSTFTWVASGVLENSTSTTRVFFVAGRKSLSAVLDRVRITTQNGTNTFDAGEVNIAYI